MPSSPDVDETTSLLSSKQNGNGGTDSAAQVYPTEEPSHDGFAACDPDVVDVEANETTPCPQDAAAAPNPGMSTSRLIQIIAVLMIGKSNHVEVNNCTEDHDQS